MFISENYLWQTQKRRASHVCDIWFVIRLNYPRNSIARLCEMTWNAVTSIHRENWSESSKCFLPTVNPYHLVHHRSDRASCEHSHHHFRGGKFLVWVNDSKTVPACSPSICSRSNNKRTHTHPSIVVVWKQKHWLCYGSAVICYFRVWTYWQQHLAYNVGVFFSDFHAHISASSLPIEQRGWMATTKYICCAKNDSHAAHCLQHWDFSCIRIGN